MKNPMQYFREGFETRKSNMIDSASNLAEYQDKGEVDDSYILHPDYVKRMENKHYRLNNRADILREKASEASNTKKAGRLNKKAERKGKRGTKAYLNSILGPGNYTKEE